MANEHIENVPKDEIPLLYSIIQSAIKETDANYFEVIGVLNLIISEILDDIKDLNEEHKNGTCGCFDNEENDED